MGLLPAFEEYLKLHRIDCLSSHGQLDAHETKCAAALDTPRVGEIVDLPAETGAESEIGSYQVERINHLFVRPLDDQMTQPTQAVPLKVSVRVSRV